MMKIKHFDDIPYIYKIVIFFYVGYFLLALLGNLIIDYRPLSIYTYIYYFIFVGTLLIGIKVGYTTSPIVLKRRAINVSKLIKILLTISIITTSISWYLTVKHYGSLVYIFTHAFDIRQETIGNGISLVPIYITYLGSVIYFGFILSLFYYNKTHVRNFLTYSILFFICIVISDLRTFGRVGILFSIFSCLSYMIISKIKLLSIKRFFIALGLYGLLMLPRLIRGGFDNFSSSISGYAEAFKVNITPALYGFVVVYIYYFSSIYAFDELILNIDIIHTNGMRNFASILNLINKIFGLNDERIILIADSAHIPFEYNIYSILGELYYDFGYIGIVIFPIMFGIIIGYIFKMAGIFGNVLKAFMLTWIFFTPIYNIFSFGAFSIALIIGIVFYMIFYPVYDTQYINNNSKL